MKTMKKLLTILLAIATAAMLAIPAFATTTPTTTEATITKTETGSITVHKYEYNGTAGFATGTTSDAPATGSGAMPLAGVTFTLYKVKNADQLVAYYEGTSTVDEFTLSDFYDENTGLKVTVAAADTYTGTTGADGTYKFDNLPVGLYVLVETDAPAKVTVKSAASLISLPLVNTNAGTNKSNNNDNAKWLYDIHVYPKNKTSVGGVTLTKVAADGTTPLQGVKFKLEKKGTGGAYAVYAVDANHGDGIYTTDENGEISLSNLPHGDYQLTETETQDGYIQDARPIQFTVTEDSKVTATDPRTGISISGKDTPQLSITLKNEKPDLTKEVQENKETDPAWTNDAQYSIGDTIPYKVTVKVPSNIADLKTFKVTDTPTGLKDDATSIVIKQGGTIYASGNYSVTANTTTGGYTIDFLPSDITPEKLATIAGKEITITYNATLLSTATIGGTGNPNTADLEYSNKINPETAPGETPPEDTKDHIEDRAIVYTYKFEITKYLDSTSGDKAPNVEFELLLTENGTAVPVVEESVGTYRLPASGETTTTTTTLKTGSDGKILVKGLENATYYLKETKTVNGYNLLSKPVAIIVSIDETTKWELSEDYVNGKLTKRTYESTTYKSGTTTLTEALVSADIINKKGFTLPQTGGLGTLTLSVIGCALVLGGALVLVNSKKRAK